jgi:hypothetical protein
MRQLPMKWFAIAKRLRNTGTDCRGSNVMSCELKRIRYYGIIYLWGLIRI